MLENVKDVVDIIIYTGAAIASIREIAQFATWVKDKLRNFFRRS